MRIEAALGRALQYARAIAQKKSGADAHPIHQVCARAAGGCGSDLFCARRSGDELHCLF